MFVGTIEGRCGKPPESRQAGQSIVCSVNVATDHGWGDRKVTTWVTLQFWGRDAEKAQEKLDKGVHVFASGEVWEESFQVQGEQRKKLVMDVKAWRLLSSSEQEKPASRPSGGRPPPPDDFGFNGW